MDIDSNMEFTNQFLEMNPCVMDTSSLMSFSIDYFMQQVPEFAGSLYDNFQGIFCHEDKNVLPVAQVTSSVENHDFHQIKKRKSMDVSESSSANPSTSVSESGSRRKNYSSRGKRLKSCDKEDEKPKEVVNVRAKRGQATDSHSLAERVRRGKINERLRCLQDIVPGCYKNMGMAVMLDEIINYVQSLQNQVEFLSMKLTAASGFYDFNAEEYAVETMQKVKAYEAQKPQRIIREGNNEGIASTQLDPFDHTFGRYLSLPYNK